MAEEAPFARTRSRKLHGVVVGLYRTADKGFETHAVNELPLTMEGMEGDRHAGLTRRSGGREPWYPRGTTIRNERQLSLLCPAELGEIAKALSLPHLRPEWIGGNLLLEGIAHFSWLPARTLLFFENGVTLKIDGDNAPCRASGRALAAHNSGRPDLELGFVGAARHRRGLVAWVEKHGMITPGERVEARLPEQWVYG